MRNLLAAALLLVFACTSGPAESRTELIGNWVVETEVDPFTNRNTVLAWVWDESYAFMLRCWHEGFDLILHSGTTVLTEDADLHFMDVGIKIGNSDPVYEYWTIFTDRQSVGQYGADAVRFAKRLVESQSKQLVFRIARMGSFETPVFDITGVERVYPKVAGTCNVR